MKDTDMEARTTVVHEGPPPDCVLLWLSPSVARDFEHRGAFPELRPLNARATRGGAMLHFLTADAA